MKEIVEEYLKKMQEELEESTNPLARMGLPAVQRLLASKALREQDWLTFQRLIIRSIAVNSSEVALAEEFPDVFHPHVAVSRREENRVYYTVLRLIEIEAELKRQASADNDPAGTSTPTASATRPAR